MQTKIAVIVAEYLRELTEEALARLGLDCSFVLAPYEHFAQIPELYRRYAGEVDGFLVSGHVAKAAAESGGPAPRRPVISFQTGLAEVYRTILIYLMEHPGQDMKRVVLDFLLPMGEECSVERFVSEENPELLQAQLYNWLRSLHPEDLQDFPSVVAHQVVELWQKGEIDCVIAMYSSIVPLLEAKGVPYRFVHVNDSELRTLARQLLTLIELDKLRASLPAVISAAPLADTSPGAVEELSCRLEAFLRENLLDCVVQREQGCCNVFTTVEVMHQLTDRGKASRLTACLGGDCPAAVGYGVAGDVSQALQNAQAARREAARSGRGSFIRNEKGDLIGPLGSAQPLVMENRGLQNAGELARRCGLSTMTIQKVAAIAKASGSNTTTTQELARRCGVTVRNANRILSRLVEGGCARVVYSQAPGSKGRPVKVYELLFE